ncbi:MAG: FecR domain-containing protein [Deltaproteobacteria bacterium]|nr:FecR domain-containing protein [Deltaproteobacteria bacterium]
METKRLASNSALKFLILLLLIIFPVSSFASVGSIEKMSGTSYFRQKGSDKWAVAGIGQPVDAGDKVKTGPDGRMSLKFIDGSKLNVGNSSELEITEFLLRKRNRSAVFSLSTGKARAIINKFSGSTDIKVKTPTSVSGVKGTDFIVMNQGSANVFFGESGKVEVSGDKGEPVYLKRSTMTENTVGASPVAPVRVEQGSALEEVRAELEAITDADKPVEWEKAGQLPNILARWNINYGDYLADGKRYTEALEVFKIAIDLTELKQIKAEAHLERGTVLARNMNEPQKALEEYNTVIQDYPETPSAENAIFSAGIVNTELENRQEATRLFKKYLAQYPQGVHKDTVEFFLRFLERD